MRRIRLIVEYDGSNYAGWQFQANAPSVQQILEEAIERATGAFSRVTGASRTDAGVHALGQCAHFDTDSSIPPEKFAWALNVRLPRDIRVRDSREVPADFHARFHASGKRYRYTVWNAPHAGALERDRSWHFFYPLDAARMHDAAQILVGTHDFSAFMATGGQVKTTVRTISRAHVTAADERVIIELDGNGFLYNMVRIIAGTLCYIGCGKLAPETLVRMLRSGNRLLGGPTAPPQGLTLVKIWYPEPETG